MPWTPDQVAYLLGKRSPLTQEEKAKMKAELHANPALGHAKKKGAKKRKKSVEEVLYG